VSSDGTNHRLALIEWAGFDAAPDSAYHDRLEQFAFEWRDLDDLLGTYA
jgi:hypothetical protein